jgi:hypothetical protein
MSQQRSLAAGLGVLFAVALFGWVLWSAVVAITGVGEAWDHPLFFVIAVPLLIGASGVAAYASPNVKYFIGVAAVALQFAALAWRGPAGAWPLILIGGGISFGAIAIVCTFAAIVVGTIREKKSKGDDPSAA